VVAGAAGEVAWKGGKWATLGFRLVISYILQ